ncbi:S8 family serine peptidase [Hamadaea flava]|uniref:S8 family serine peptidase n=1 Tax=Hamadaea flava TaxID=1742688 RepID=A0ABV8LH27_9ACTN
MSVAIIDTGVDATHPAVKGRVAKGADFSAGGQSSTGNGWIDRNGHGTQMAGLVVGFGRVQGVAPAATVIPVNASVTSSALGTARLAEGIRWAVGQHVKVISISSGGDDDLRLRQAVELAIANDIVIVAAAGNAGEDAAVTYPAAYRGVISACGVDRMGAHSTISIIGPELTLCAPSNGISSAYPGGRYVVGSGTSEATALIAGAAALIRSKFPTLTATQVMERLYATAIDRGAAGKDDVYGYGVIDVVRALTADLPPSAPASSPSFLPTSSPDARVYESSQDTKPWLIVLGSILCLVLLAVGSALAVAATRSSKN